MNRGMGQESFYRTRIEMGHDFFFSVMGLGWYRSISVGLGWDRIKNPLLCHPRVPMFYEGLLQQYVMYFLVN